MRHCGTCSLCCNLPPVPSIEKRAWGWCKYCPTGYGCAIWERPNYPDGCRNFQCVWTLKEDLPLKLRPDKCHVIFEVVDQRNFVALVDPHYPNAWREKPVSDVISSMLDEGFAVAVEIEKETHFLLPKERSLDEVMMDLKVAMEKKHDRT